MHWLTAGYRRPTCAAAVLALAALGLHAQQSFEAASVRPSKGVIPWSYSGGPGTKDPAQITYSNVTFGDIVERAFEIRSYQLQGAPSWFDSERYTIVAKVRPGASPADAREMMRTLLAERFQLAAHRETREGRCYNLVVDKGGPRLKPGTEGESMERATLLPDGNGGLTVPDNALSRPVTLAGKRITSMVGAGGASILGNSQQISALANMLTNMMDGPVRDATELTGVYDFSLFFAPPGMRGPQPGPQGDMLPGFTAGEPPLSIFQVLREKLGLRLEIVRGAVELLIIDHAERVPTAN